MRYPTGRGRGTLSFFLVLWSLAMPRSTGAQGTSLGSGPLAEGERALRDGKYERAIEMLTKAEQDAPQGLEARLLLGIAYGFECQALRSGSPDAVGERGQCSSAKAEFHHVLQRDPKELSALNWMGALTFGELPGGVGPESFRKLNEASSYRQAPSGIP